MPVITINRQTLYPNHPNLSTSEGRRQSGSYFSLIRHISSQNNTNYIPPTRTQFEKFMYNEISRLNTTPPEPNYIDLCSFLSNHLNLSDLFPRICSVYSNYINSPDTTYRRRGIRTTYGTDALNFLLVCFNVYALFKKESPEVLNSMSSYTVSPHCKVDYICLVPESGNEINESRFHGRCVFNIKESTIRRLLGSSFTSTEFWRNIHETYNRICQTHIAVFEHIEGGRRHSRMREAIRNEIRNISENTTARNVIISDPVVLPDPIIIPRIRDSLGCNNMLSREYLGRVRDEEPISAQTLVEMIMKIKSQNKISPKITNIVYELLISSVMSDSEGD